MVYTDKPLDNPLNWSFRVGRISAIDIRIHVTFILCAIILIWMEMPKDDAIVARSFGSVLIDALGIYAILFFVVLVHEFGHCFGARYMGGEADEILLWPLGGLAMTSPPHTPQGHMVTTVAGPMVNVVFCGVASVALSLWLGTLGAVPWNPLHPMRPVDATIIPTTGQLWLMRFFGVSYFLLLINLLPIFPFDGGRIVQAWLWPRKGYRASMEIATGTGMVGAILVGLFALFIDQSSLLLMIAIFGYLNCWQTRRTLKESDDYDMGEYSGSFDGGYRVGEDGQGERKPGPIARWKQQRAKARQQHIRLEEEQRESSLERVLAKISQSGMDALTPKERVILDEETKRRQKSSQ